MTYLNTLELFVRTITYQYDQKGRIDTAMGGPSIEVSMDEDIDQLPARYRAWIEERSRPGTWDRLVELTAAQLARLSDNKIVNEAAWLCGLHPDGGEDVAAMRAWQIKARARRDEEAARKAERERLKAAAAEGIVCTVVERWPYGASVRVTVDGGEPLCFQCRNIFDVGYVVNPEYEIAPGVTGGLATRSAPDAPLIWQHFVRPATWSDVRLVTPEEERALVYLGWWPPIETKIRM